MFLIGKENGLYNMRDMVWLFKIGFVSNKIINAIL
jgi:hypothetical protein